MPRDVQYLSIRSIGGEIHLLTPISESSLLLLGLLNEDLSYSQRRGGQSLPVLHLFSNNFVVCPRIQKGRTYDGRKGKVGQGRTKGPAFEQYEPS